MKVILRKNQFKLKYGAMVVFLMLVISSTCNPPGNIQPAAPAAGPAAGVQADETGSDGAPTAKDAPEIAGDSLWADTSGVVPPDSTTTVSGNITMDVRDANLLDVLSVLAIKMDGEIIFLEEPGKVTFKVTNLPPLTAFQLLLQKEGLDYLVVGRHYLVGDRARLHQDYFNRMALTRYGLEYISAATLQRIINDLGIPLRSITVEANQQAIWVQGTPIALGKVRELVNAMDRPENADPAEGGFEMFVYYLNNTVAGDIEQRLGMLDLPDVRTVTLNYPEFTRQLLVITPAGIEDRVRRALRELDGVQHKIRYPVASAIGDHAFTALQAQRTLLEELITDAYFAGEYPRIEPEDLFWNISDDLSGDAGLNMRILWVEGTPDDINMIRTMVDEIRFIADPREDPGSLEAPEEEEAE